MTKNLQDVVPVPYMKKDYGSMLALRYEECGIILVLMSWAACYNMQKEESLNKEAEKDWQREIEGEIRWVGR
jgi:hypothetical protein